MQIRTILFPTDFSQGARAAMDHAISLAQDYKAKLILLYVIQDISIAEWYIPSSISAADLVEDMQKSAAKEMERWGAEAAGSVQNVEKLVVRGVPFVEIIRTAKDKNADLIVIGTHGRTGIDHMLFGSTAEKVVRKSSCPVLTVRELLARVEEVGQRQRDIIADQLRRNDVAVFMGEASFKDSHTVVVRSDQGSALVTAANILIAVGTTPAPPPGVSAEPGLVVTSDELLQLTLLPRRLAVVGAGVIGIEYASMFAALGIDVTVIDKRDRPLEFLDREIVDELLSQMRNADVMFRLGEAVGGWKLLSDRLAAL